MDIEALPTADFRDTGAGSGDGIAGADKTIILTPGDGPESDWEACYECSKRFRPEPGNEILRCPFCGAARRREHRSLEPGEMLGHYKLLRPIGHGGMSDLFLCAPTADLTRRFALKMLQANHSVDTRRRFVREAELIRELDHPNIVRLEEAWEEERGAFMVMEYIDGRDLEQMREDTPFDEENTLLIGYSVASALSYAWDTLKLLHRDIKPSNIMITGEGDIKLLDFGIAKSLDPEPGADSITMTGGGGVGTPGYMSPEQFRNFKDLNCTSDIFSLGATLYYLLTGAPPFPGKTSVEVLQRMLTGEPRDLREAVPELSAPCARLVHDMINRNPKRRPMSWRQLLVDFEKVMSGHMPLPH